jgi:hypothetical protein
VPAGSFDLSPIPAGLSVPAAPVIVCLYDPGGENPYTILPNVFCLRIDYREGAEPPLARFQYMMGDLLEAALGWPSQFEQLWPIDAQGNYIVQTDDRMVVLTQDPQGNAVVLFDGFAQIPQADLSAQTQSVTFVAQGVAIRLWDLPIFGRIQRDASNSTDTSGESDVQTQLPCRFNPSDSSIGTNGGYVGNCVDDFTELEEISYPIFLDPLCSERGVGTTTFWQIGDVMSYLIATEPSPVDDIGNPYVIYPTLDQLQDLLACYAPPDDGLSNPGADAETQIQIRDYDASNKAVPDAMAEILRYAGFVMIFFTDTANGGSPQTALKIVRKDAQATSAPKVLLLNADGAGSLDLTANNVASMHLARDLNQVVNQWTVETGLKQVEITVDLAPLFQPSSGDASDRTPFFLSNTASATAAQRRMYRWWGADECGDGHWNVDTTEWVTDTPIDLTPVFPVDKDGNYTYVDRYRPGSKTLISKDSNGKPLKANLQIAVNETSDDPKIDPGAGSTGWVDVPHGWKLLDDRLGIECTANDPDDWTTGATKIPGSSSLSHIRALTWMATPTTATNFMLRLTTVIDADYQLDISAVKRTASPTKFARERTVDGKDHFQYCTISKSSRYYSTQTDEDGDSGDNTNPLVCRDDTKAATTHAEQLRSTHEFPTLAGAATLPFITDYYQIGDRVKIIQGRNANLQINVGVDQGETPCYPWVTAFAWDFQGDKQQTILQFSDRRAEPQGV